MSIRRLGEEIKDWEKEKDDMEEHGERIASVDELRKMAKKCEGSRDVGAQLFCALLRGLGIDTRIVANLQPAGIGWSKAEEANAKKPKKDRKFTSKVEPEPEPEPEVEEVAPKAGKRKTSLKQKPKAVKPSRKSSRGNKAEPISLDDDDEDSPLSSAPADTEAEPIDVDDDDESIVDV
ncbi:hypothetical protein KC352_g44818, partial [Hortaea werneckii]